MFIFIEWVVVVDGQSSNRGGVYGDNVVDGSSVQVAAESYSDIEEDDDFETELEREIVEAVQADNDEAEAKNAEDETDLGAMTVIQLKERLRSKGLPVSGRKAELIERLQQ